MKVIDGLIRLPQDPSVHGGQRDISRPVEHASRRQPHPERSGIDTVDEQRKSAAHDDGRPRRPRVCKQECGADEERFGKNGVGRTGRMSGHERVVLGLGWSSEDVFEVEYTRFEALQLGALEEPVDERAVVEVGLGGERYKRRPSGGHLVREARPGDETDVVAPLDEPLRGRQ